MTLLIKQIINLIKMLHSETGLYQITWGLTLGAFLGFSPFFSIQTFLIFLILLIFRVQFGAAFLSAFFFKLVAFMIDPLADSLGRWALESPSARPLWTSLYNMPVIPYTRFNNSIVMGSFLVALVLAPFLFFLFKLLITKYRTYVVVNFEKTKIWKAIKATKFYDYYAKYDDLYGRQG
ncbi:MAG: TIGR03546 family protein [Moraxellaceae bacterium]|nr:TIGR03546 family protein [Pseudobdellovibrionaceae bacterium]